MQTPSPITPDFSYEPGMDSPVFAQNGFFVDHKGLGYPMHQQSGPHPYHTNASPAGYFRPDHLPEQHSDQAALNARPKKNSYPCPMAKQFGCNDFFTTSGHAARHAKKHTGKKDAFCPECNKAFTRKDNMEQHRRTHQNVRGPSKSSTDGRVKKSTKPVPRKSVSGPLEAAAVAQLEDHQSQQHQIPQHHLQFQSAQQPIMSTSPYYINPDPIQPLPQPILADFNTRPPLYHRSNYASSLDYLPAQASLIQDPDLQYSYPSPGLSNGLDTLALAASDHRRMSDEGSC
jgi:hypothetical protein